MATDGKQRALTELEGAVLGVVVSDGPCTPYVVKERFRASPSEFWSGSAGSIYPLMKRLELRGLVTSQPGSTGRRGHRSYRVTPGGRRAFARWMSDGVRAAAMGFDPLRTRLVFLGELSPGGRAEFRSAVDAALEELPVPSPADDRRLQQLHRIWKRARRRAFEEVFALFDDAD